MLSILVTKPQYAERTRRSEPPAYNVEPPGRSLDLFGASLR